MHFLIRHHACWLGVIRSGMDVTSFGELANTDPNLCSRIEVII